MRLIFFGTADFGAPALRRLAEHTCLVVTQPDRPRGRGQKMTPTPIGKVAEELGIPTEKPKKARAKEFVELIRGQEADALLVAAYGQILSESLLGAAKHGGINLHGSLLPRWRGAAPIQRAILAGDEETGITLMQMDKGLDTGDIIAMESIGIGPQENAGELFTRLADLAADMAEEWMPRIACGDYPRTKQDDALATYADKIESADGEVDLAGDAAHEHRRIRAFTPFPGAYLDVGGKRLKVLEARVEDRQGKPGEVLCIHPDVVVATGSGALELLTVQPEGRRPMSGQDWANGARLKPGMTLYHAAL